jgi:hypothetical protein
MQNYKGIDVKRKSRTATRYQLTEFGDYRKAAYTETDEITDIHLPYMDFVFSYQDKEVSRQVWHTICDIARAIIVELTGEMTVQNWTDKITCACYPTERQAIQDMVNDSVNRYLTQAQMTVETTGRLLYEVKHCWHDILSSWQTNSLNNYVVVTDPHCMYGKLTITGSIQVIDQDGMILRLLPSDSTQDSILLHEADIITLYRITNIPEQN